MRTYLALAVTGWSMAGWTARAAPVAFTRGNIHLGAAALPCATAVLADAHVHLAGIGSREVVAEEK